MIATVLRRAAARATLLAGAAMFVGSAYASDRPATPEGVKTIQALFDRFLPAAPAGTPPLVSVKPEGQNYVVSIDLASMNGFLRGAGTETSYESAPLLIKLVEQDDGKWRIAQDSFPKIVAHVKDLTSVTEIENYRQTMVVDPALAWFVNCAASADKGTVAAKAPNFDQAFEFGPLKADCATTVDANGTVSSTIKEEVDAIAFKVSGTDKEGKPVNASGRIDKTAFNVGVDGLKSRKLFDLVALLSAHRSDLAEHEAELKDLLRPLAAPGLRFVEGGEATKMLFASPVGAVALAGMKLAVGVSNAGPDSTVDATVSAAGLSLPVGLVPPAAADLVPSKIDVAATVKGFDIAAAANQAIDALHLGGQGPAISDVDSARVSAALIGAGPLKVVFAPSHVVAPAIDADVQGELHYSAGKASGVATLRMRGFDKTMTAVRGLGPDIAMKSLPVIAMAKGLAKSESDGALSWVIEVGDDRSIKVNGLPLGKTPQ